MSWPSRIGEEEDEKGESFGEARSFDYLGDDLYLFSLFSRHILNKSKFYWFFINFIFKWVVFTHVFLFIFFIHFCAFYFIFNVKRICFKMADSFPPFFSFSLSILHTISHEDGERGIIAEITDRGLDWEPELFSEIKFTHFSDFLQFLKRFSTMRLTKTIFTTMNALQRHRIIQHGPGPSLVGKKQN